jgi:hypothetical protein
MAKIDTLPFRDYSRTSVHCDFTWPFRPLFGHVGLAIDRAGGRYGWTTIVCGHDMVNSLYVNLKSIIFK